MNNKKATITFIRSGATQEGLEGRFLGLKDEPLAESSKKELEKKTIVEAYPKVSRVYCSTQKRCLETSYIIYPKIPAIATPELRGFNYGSFAGKTYAEIISTPAFKEAARKSEMALCPDGEDIYLFKARTAAAFQNILAEIAQTQVSEVAIISCKEVIMPILRRYSVPRTNYGDYPLNYGGGIRVSWDINTGIGRILNFL